MDTSASYCLVPHKSIIPRAEEPCLISPNSFRTQCWGEERRRLRFGSCTFEGSFLHADVSFSIIGVDFLHGYKLLVDVASTTLEDSNTGDT